MSKAVEKYNAFLKAHRKSPEERCAMTKAEVEQYNESIRQAQITLVKECRAEDAERGIYW